MLFSSVPDEMHLYILKIQYLKYPTQNNPQFFFFNKNTKINIHVEGNLLAKKS